MKRKIFVLSIIIIVFFSINLFISRINNIVLNISERGFYNVYFYNVNTKEKIDYGKKLNLFGKISIDNKKTYKHSKINIENQYLIVVESDNYIGFTSYTIFHYENKSFYYKDTGIDIIKHVNTVYKEKYKDNNLDIKLIKKKSPESLKIKGPYQSCRIIKILHNDEGLFKIYPGAYIINSTINEEEIIGKQFFINLYETYGNISEQVMQNANIYQFFIYQLIVLSNDIDQIEIEIPGLYNGGIKASLADHIDLEEFNKFLELANLHFYPIK